MAQKANTRFLIWPWVVCFLYIFSGIAALSYEVLWARMLSTVFGVSTFGIVITVSAFMAGLGLGSLFGSTVLSKVKRPLLFFGLIELSVSFFAFNLPVIFSTLDSFLASSFVPEQYAYWIVVQSIFTFALMMIPAFLLGIGYPLILAVLEKRNVRVGVVYSMNTLGGAMGALTPLFLLPTFGWIVSERLVAIFAGFLGVLMIVMHFTIVRKYDSQAFRNKITNLKSNYALLSVYAGIGAAAIILEIAWTRLYGMFMLRTEYVLAVILATFLFGIGIGSLVAANLKHKIFSVVIPITIVVCGLFNLYSLSAISSWAESVEYTSLADSMISQGMIVSMCTIIATLAFGAWYPFLANLNQKVTGIAPYLYGANSVGAAVGGLVMGFVLLPTLGSTGAIVFACVLVVVCSWYWIEMRNYRIGSILLLLLFVPVLTLPTVKDLLPITQSDAIDLMRNEDTISLTHVISDSDGQRILLQDLQRMDASTDQAAVAVQKNQARLPLMLHSKPKDILFLGLGTGITASGSLPYQNINRTAIELSNGSIDAAKHWFTKSNANILQYTEIINDDIRRYLKTTKNNYDVVIGDLFHPDLAGRSTLLSIQQFQNVSNRLRKNGIFVQWIALNQLDESSLFIILRTFQKAFPNSHIFMDGFRLAMLGINGQFGGIESMEESFSLLNEKQQVDIMGGEGKWSWLGRYWGRINVSGNMVQDEWAPVIEYQLPKAKFNRQIQLRSLLTIMLNMRPKLSTAMTELRIKEKDSRKFESAYLATEMYVQSWISLFSGEEQRAQELLEMSFLNNPQDRWIGFSLADKLLESISEAVKQGYTEKEVLTKILQIRPDHIGALKAMSKIMKLEGDNHEYSRILVKIKELSPYSNINAIH